MKSKTDNLSDSIDNIKNRMNADAFILDDNVIFVENMRISELNSFIRLNHVILLVCLKGQMQIVVNEKLLSVKKDDLLICVEGFIVGQVAASPDFDCKVLYLKSNVITQLLIHSERDVWDKYYYLKNHPVIPLYEAEVRTCKLYYNIFKAKCNDEQNTYSKNVNSLLLKAVFFEILNFVNRQCGDTKEEYPLMTQGDLLFKRFYDMLCANYLREKKVTFYADKLCVTPKYLSTVCKRISGKTASCWIDEMIMSRIKDLLLHSNMSIKEICNECEFASMSFFGKYVKAHVGVSPNEYRRRYLSSKR